MCLSVDWEKCDSCKDCLRNCPQRLSSLNALKCRHCKPEEAPCLIACSRKAIFEVSKGILSVDQEECDGCRKCIEACEFLALELVEGKARKCDLCAGNNFEISCARNCWKELISVKKDLAESSQGLGWGLVKVKSEEIEKTLKKEDCFELLQLRNGEKIYQVNSLPLLSEQETELIKEVLDGLRENREEKESSKLIHKIMQDYCEEKLIDLDKEQENYLLKVIDSIVFGFGPMNSLLENDDLEEIALIGTEKEKPVYVFEQSFGWMKTNLFFSSEETARNLVNRMARKLGRRLSFHSPKLNAVLPDGSRLNSSTNPIAFTGINLTIRKFRKQPLTPIDLLNYKTLSSELLAFIWMAMQTDLNLLIVGNTGSGKTTSLNALFCFVPKNERIIVAEETPEINLPHKHLLKLRTADEIGVGLNELIENTLRMRPDRVIVGEMRNQEEVKAFIDTVLAGQGKGSYASFHSQSSQETITRLKKLGVLEIDLAAIDLIVVQKRWDKIEAEKNLRKEKRNVVEVSEVELDEERIKLNCLWKFNYRKECLEKVNESRKVKEKIMNSYGLNEKEFRKELKKKEELLKGMKREKPSLEEFFERIN